ncbi:MAG TPA: glucan biosynthesis protein, partial [Pirellulales bacterium]
MRINWRETVVVVGFVSFLGTGALTAQIAAAGDSLKSVGEPQAFSFNALKTTARELAAAPYQAPPGGLPKPIASLTWDQMQQIRFKPESALWRNEDTKFRIRFFHLGLF